MKYLSLNYRYLYRSRKKWAKMIERGEAAAAVAKDTGANFVMR